ncbi:MAG: trypsin-like peptidase domain-containing protein [Azoarcus sp.]|jgi:serine protease DegS/serine protease DegQ|nr:trypsin-like peptidase domain-containing protein [Azoarcus sp.]
MRRLWLIFAQAVTVSVAVLFVIGTFRPEWVRGTLMAPPVVPTVTVVETPSSANVVSHAGAVQQALPAVVYISTRQEARAPSHPLVNDPLFRRFFGTPERTGLGSGVLVSPEGFILTNNHVIENADEIEVTLIDGRKFDVYLVGRDPETDLAVLKLVTGGSSLPAIPFAPANSLAVGDIVLAIGNPFGFRQTVTMGIASALGRHHLGISTFENYIQTDAAINPGSSGGALIDGSGRLVGINTLIYSGTGQSLGIGFAIPVSIARKVLEQIIANGEVVRGWVGVEMREITPDAAVPGMPANGGGVLISGVLDGSPADQGGVRPHDILIAVDEQSVQNSRDMLDLVAALSPGQTAAFRVLRNGKEIELKITVGRRPPPQQPARR